MSLEEKDGLTSALKQRMAKVGVKEADLIEKFVTGSGPGGQKINKTSSCVQLQHELSGIEINCQDGRSRAINRVIARERLCERLEQIRRDQILEARRKRARERALKKKRSAASKRRMREQKKRRSEKKSWRKSVD